jgi:hypothetical protein
VSQDLTDIVTMMLKVDANHDPSEANELLSAGAREIERLRAREHVANDLLSAGAREITRLRTALAEIAEEMNAPIVLRGGA